MPNRKPAFDALAVQLLLYFLENPDEELCTPEVRVKFGMSTSNLLQSLAGALSAGWLARRGGGVGNPVTWMAGPRLLAVLRRAAVGGGAG